jgi:hypothetical protein
VVRGREWECREYYQIHEPATPAPEPINADPEPLPEPDVVDTALVPPEDRTVLETVDQAGSN